MLNRTMRRILPLHYSWKLMHPQEGIWLSLACTERKGWISMGVLY